MQKNTIVFFSGRRSCVSLLSLACVLLFSLGGCFSKKDPDDFLVSVSLGDYKKMEEHLGAGNIEEERLYRAFSLSLRMCDTKAINMLLDEGLDIMKERTHNAAYKNLYIDDLFGYCSVNAIRKVIGRTDKHVYEDRLAYHVARGVIDEALYEQRRHWHYKDVNKEAERVVRRMSGVSKFIVDDLVGPEVVASSIELICYAQHDRVRKDVNIFYERLRYLLSKLDKYPARKPVDCVLKKNKCCCDEHSPWSTCPVNNSRIL